MAKRTDPQTYEEALSMTQSDFVTYLYQYIQPIEIDMDDPEGIRKAGKFLTNRANVLIFFTELNARAGIAKRDYKRQEIDADDPARKKELKRMHEDMIDKERFIDNAIKAIEIQYRATNRALTVWMEGEKEKYMPEGIKGR